MKKIIGFCLLLLTILVISPSVARADCNQEDAPSITVISPNGGETFTAGDDISVSWTSCNIPKDATMAVSVFTDINDPDSPQGSAILVDNTGSTIYTLSTDLPTGSNYKVRVNLGVITPIMDFSDDFFTINSLTPTPSITLTSPNGGEVYQLGQEINIDWETDGFDITPNIGFDLVIYDQDNGGDSNSFYISRTDLPNTGSYSATIPENVPAGSNYKIRIFSYDPSYDGESGYDQYYKIDLSDDTFTIGDIQPEEHRSGGGSGGSYVDQCSNILDMQKFIPTGYVLYNKLCITEAEYKIAITPELIIEEEQKPIVPEIKHDIKSDNNIVKNNLPVKKIIAKKITIPPADLTASVVNSIDTGSIWQKIKKGLSSLIFWR